MVEVLLTWVRFPEDYQLIRKEGKYGVGSVDSVIR